MHSTAIVRHDRMFIKVHSLFLCIFVLLTLATSGRVCPSLCVVTVVSNLGVFALLFSCNVEKIASSWETSDSSIKLTFLL